MTLPPVVYVMTDLGEGTLDDWDANPAFADDRGILSRLMAQPLFERFGIWSYAIYIVQMFVIASMASMLDLNAITGVKADGLLAIYLDCVLALAIVGWYFVEIPGPRLSKLFLSDKVAR